MTSQGRTAWEIAGLVPEFGDALGSPTLTDGEVLVPQSVEPYGQYVRWQYTGWEARSSDGMLDALLRLRTPDQVGGFIRRYGPIEFCMEHRLPIGHNPTQHDIFTDSPELWQLSAGVLWEDHEPGQPSTGCTVSMTPDRRWWVEDPAMYLKLAIQFRTGLDLASSLRSANPKRPSWADIGSEEKWRTFSLGWHGRPIVDHWPERPVPLEVAVAEDIHLARHHFEVYLRLFVRWARIRPSVVWRKDRDPKFVIEADSFGRLLLQFMLAATASQTLAICDGCGEAYPRAGRRPQSGRRNYCSGCREAGVPARDAKREQRARARSSKEDGREQTR